MLSRLLLALAVVVMLAPNGAAAAAAGSSVTATIHVADRLNVDATNISTAEGATIRGPIATFSDGNPAIPSSAFTATVMWGDGTTSAGIVRGASGAFSVTASHAYDEEGSYGLAVLVQEISGSSASGSGQVRVADAALFAHGFNLRGGGTLSAVIATYGDKDPHGNIADYTVTIAWGDGSTSPGVIAAGTGDGWLVRGTHGYRVDKTFHIIIRIHDAGGARTSDSTAYTAWHR